MSRPTRLLQQHRDGLRFCLLFSLYTLLIFLGLWALQSPVVEPFTRGVAWLTYRVLRVVGVQTWTAGATVGMGGFGVEIRNNCNAVYEIGLYAAAVFAYPAPLRQRLVGVGFGAVVLYVVNLIRVISLIFLGVFFPEWFQWSHLYVWQGIFLALVVGAWISWVSRVH